MGFLQPYIGIRKRETNLVHETDEDSNTENQEELVYEDNHEEDIVVEPGSQDREDEGGTPENTSKTPTQETPLDFPGSSREKTPTPLKKIKKTDNSAEMLSILLKSIENRRKRAEERAGISERVQPQSDPSLYHFFMSMYESTKRMPSSSQHVVKNQIYKAVADMEATLLDIPQNNTFHPSQFIPYHDQHQYDPYYSSERSISPPLSSYSDSQARKIEATTQNDPQVKEERDSN